MIVLDTSVAIEFLLGTRSASAIRARVSRPGQRLCAPHLLDVEVMQVLRRYQRQGNLSPQRAGAALSDLRDLPVTRYAAAAFLRRIWELRANLSAYDAAYISLAEALEAPLLTLDASLRGAPGHRARIEVL